MKHFCSFSFKLMKIVDFLLFYFLFVHYGGAFLPDVFWQLLDKYFKCLAFSKDACLFSSGKRL